MKYVYEGAFSGVTIGDREILLIPNTEVELPEDNEYVQTLCSLGLLKKVEQVSESRKKREEKE